MQAKKRKKAEALDALIDGHGAGEELEGLADEWEAEPHREL